MPKGRFWKGHPGVYRFQGTQQWSRSAHWDLPLCPPALPDPPVSSGYAYFLRGRLYWKFDPVKVKALEGFPRLVGPDFFGCTEPANTFR